MKVSEIEFVSKMEISSPCSSILCRVTAHCWKSRIFSKIKV